MIKNHPLYNNIRNSICGKEELFDFFRDNKIIHHVTSSKNLFKILETKEIRYNNGTYKDSFPQSKSCYARHKKCVSLFDLVTPTIKQLTEVIDNWVNIISRIDCAVFINFDLKKISNKLILNNKFRDDATKLKKMRIGYIEALYPDSLKILESKNFLIIDKNILKIYPNTIDGLQKLKNNLQSNRVRRGTRA